MAAAYPEQTAREWAEDVRRALLKGELLIVIDDHRKKIGLVRSDRPPFLALVKGPGVAGAGLGGPEPADPLGIKRWPTGEKTHDAEPKTGGSGRDF